MKKLIAILTFSLLSAIPACAQYWGPYAWYSATPSMQDFGQRVSRRILGLVAVDWVRHVRKEERYIDPSGPLESSLYVFSTTHFDQNEVVASDKAVFEQRLSVLRKAVKQNHTLKEYTLIVPFPSDLVIPPAEDMNYLLHFLAQPADKAHFNAAYTPSSVKQVERGVTEIRLRDQRNTLILRVDSFTRKVYFFLNSY